MSAVKSKSLIRNFSIIFVLVALVPFIVLYYLYVYLDESQKNVSIFNINFTIILIILGIIILGGFFVIRMTLKKASLLTKTVSKSALRSINEADEKVMLELAKGDGEIADLAKSFLSIIKRSDMKKDQADKPATEVMNASALKINAILSSQNSFGNLMHEVLENLRDAVGARHVALFSADNNRYTLKHLTSIEKTAPLEKIASSAQEYLEKIDKQKVSLLPTVSEKDDKSATIFSPPAAFSPLIHDGRFLGMLCLSGNMYWKNLDNFSGEHLSVILALSRQIAASLENANADDRPEKPLFDALVALAQAVEARDPYSRGHAQRVSKYAQKMAELMGLPETDLKTIHQASLLHDIGKIGIKYNVLFKSGRLTRDELQVIRNHPQISEVIVANLKSYANLLAPIRHHHEQIDGTGYPDGLMKDDISAVTQIVSVANLYDVLQMQRPYRARMDNIKMDKEMSYLIKLGKIDKEIVHFLYRAARYIHQEAQKKNAAIEIFSAIQ